MSAIEVLVDPHPSLAPAAFVTRFPRGLGEIDAAPLAPLLDLDAPAPVTRDEETRAKVRDLLRHGGYKPTGRGKPASEYLVRAASEGKLSSINAAVDACNVVSLASGLPISVVDLERASAPFRLALAKPGTEYVFNASGQSIDVSGLLSLWDADGPCANAVKDAQRTKTHAETRATLSIVWGEASLPDKLEAATAWYRELLASIGATTEDVRLG